MQNKPNRIVLTGPESSGKTHLALFLASLFQLPLVEEASREYLANTKTYSIHDLPKIARLQEERIQAAEKNKNVIVSDTDGLTIVMWMKLKFGNDATSIAKHFFPEKAFYLLCKPDIPWEYDPLRENPDDRDVIYAEYLAYFQENKLPFVVIEGNFKKRETQAKQAVEKFFSELS